MPHPHGTAHASSPHVHVCLRGADPLKPPRILSSRCDALVPFDVPFIRSFGDVGPGEAFLQLMVDTHFMNIDIPLWGWACDK